MTLTMTTESFDKLQTKYMESLVSSIGDLFDQKTKNLELKMEAIHAQTKITNGRVTKLEETDKIERKRLELFHLMGKYPKITTSLVLFILALLISDLRHPVMKYLGFDVG